MKVHHKVEALTRFNQHKRYSLVKVHHKVEVLTRFNQHNLMFYTLVKFRSYNPSSNFNIYLWNSHARSSQPSKVVKTLHKMPQPSDNLVTALQDCGKVATT